MSHSTIAIVVAGLILVAGPLLGENIPEPAKFTKLPDTALPSDLDRMLRDYVRAWRAGDAVALASLFTEDGFVVQSNRSPIRGRPDIHAACERQGRGRLRLRALAFAAGEMIGYIIGAYGSGDTPGDTGKFTLTLQRAPGEPWLIFSDMGNLNLSPQHRPAPNTP